MKLTTTEAAKKVDAAKAAVTNSRRDLKSKQTMFENAEAKNLADEVALKEALEELRQVTRKIN